MDAKAMIAEVRTNQSALDACPAVHMAEHLKACPDEIVAVPLPLAQRILAALEDCRCVDGAVPLACELRAAVERKP